MTESIVLLILLSLLILLEGIHLFLLLYTRFKTQKAPTMFGLFSKDGQLIQLLTLSPDEPLLVLPEPLDYGLYEIRQLPVYMMKDERWDIP